MHQRSLLISRKQFDLTKHVKVSNHVCECIYLLYMLTNRKVQCEKVGKYGRAATSDRTPCERWDGRRGSYMSYFEDN